MTKESFFEDRAVANLLPTSRCSGIC